MARNLAAVISRSPAAMVIVLTGNIHSRITRGSARNADYQPMGYLLGQTTGFDRLVALNVAHDGGSAWVCTPDCGVNRLRGRHGQSKWRIEIDEATRPAGHSGWYHVGSITASLPARMPPSEVSIPAPTTASADPERGDVRVGGAEAATEPQDQEQQQLTEAEKRLQGDWQAYDYSSDTKTWVMSFQGRRFRAQAGEDDWYEGQIELGGSGQPGHIDFRIEDCRCSYKGLTSKAIYSWDDPSLILAAPQPGAPRPSRFVETSGQMMRLLPRKASRDR